MCKVTGQRESLGATAWVRGEIPSYQDGVICSKLCSKIKQDHFQQHPLYFHATSILYKLRADPKWLQWLSVGEILEKLRFPSKQASIQNQMEYVCSFKTFSHPLAMASLCFSKTFVAHLSLIPVHKVHWILRGKGLHGKSLDVLGVPGDRDGPGMKWAGTVRASSVLLTLTMPDHFSLVVSLLLSLFLVNTDNLKSIYLSNFVAGSQVQVQAEIILNVNCWSLET